MKRIWMGWILLLFLYGILQAQSSVGDVVGYVRDARSGEALPFANVMIKGTQYGAATNVDGYFVIVNVPVGPCSLAVHYIGYRSKVLSIRNEPGGTYLDKVPMDPTVIEVEGVVVTAQAEMMDAAPEAVSQVTISPRQLSSLPSIGEVDVFRTMQLLPGISGASDGESGLYVRGGTPDQNLILFDGMKIYHVDHFFGFFSAFNADAVKDIQMFKGGFPAQYGDRISSVVNLTGKTGNVNYPRFGVGANLLSAHGYFETPVWDKGTFLIAGRRSYTDFIQSPLYDSIYELMTGDEEGGATGGPMTGGRMRGGRFTEAEFRPSFYFYDLNAKLTLRPTALDHLTFSFYAGKDDLDESQDFGDIPLKFNFSGDDTESDATLQTTDFSRWGNVGASAKWARQWSNRFHTDLSAAYSEYFSEADRGSQISGMVPVADDSLQQNRGFGFASDEDNLIRDVTLRWDNKWHVAQAHEISFGVQSSLFDSRYTATMNDTIQILDLEGKAWQHAGYLQDEWKWNRLKLNLGLRTSYYGKTEDLYVEPRASYIYKLSETMNFKGAWGHYYQFVNRIVNEQVTEGSRDFWLLSDDVLKPAFAEHYILGVDYDRGDYYFSVEGYWKNMENLVEFTRRFRRDDDSLGDFSIGNGVAKGVEFLAQKKRGKITGWIGYTLGKVEHTFETFNDGNPFPADHDRRHELNGVFKLNLGKWTFSATSVFATGKAYTAPVSQYYIALLDGEATSYIHVGNKNGQRLPDYLRVDVSVSRKFGNDEWDWDVGLSVFNLTNHDNVWYREYNMDTTPVTISDALMLGFTPTVYLQLNVK